MAVVTGEFAWDDVGTWQALTRVRPKDPSGNVVVGRALVQDSHDCIVWSDRDPIVLCGVAGPGRRAGQRPDPGHADRAGGRDEAAARRPPARDPRHRLMTALYLLEPDRPGAAWAPFAGVRPIAELRAGAWRIRERWEAAVRGRGRRRFWESTSTGFAEGDEPPRAAAGRDRRARPSSVPAWFAPTGDPCPALEPDDARLTHQGATVGWVVAAGERWEGPHERGDAARDRRAACSAGASTCSRRSSASARGLRRLSRGRASDGVPEGSIVLGDPADVVVMGAAVEPGVVFDVRHGAVVLEPGVEVRHGTRLEGPVFVGARSQDARRLHSRLGVRTRVPGPRRDLGERVPGLRQQEPRRLRGPQRRGPLGQSRRPHHDLESQEHLRSGAARGGRRADRDRTARTSARLFGDHAKTAIGTMLATGTVIGGRGQRLRRADAAQVRAAVRLGRRRRASG